ncbi:hypothetical protein [Streptomyces sp. NPDC056948]|uniref:hypothetical protein n=1 Tax=Streptomyces sp. NPDC056948 TaxID=3345975 RepID=UPI0036412E89
MRFPSPHADVELPESGLHAYLFAGLGPADLDRVALVSVESGGALTYGLSRTRVDGFAAELAARGAGPGDTVALLCPNLPAPGTWQGSTPLDACTSSTASRS